MNKITIIGAEGVTRTNVIYVYLPESNILKKSNLNLLKSVTEGLFQHNKLYTQIDGVFLQGRLFFF